MVRASYWAPGPGDGLDEEADSLTRTDDSGTAHIVTVCVLSLAQ